MLDRLRGVIPPATTPFRENGDLDLDATVEEVRWLIEQGAHGVVVGGSTGEGHTLDVDEFRELTTVAVEAADGRIPVMAGIIVDSTKDALLRAKAISHVDVAALQITPVHYLFRPDDDAMLVYFREISEESSRPIIIYNVVPWSYLSPRLLCRIMDEVDGVVGVKQSAGDLKLLADLALMAKSEQLIFSAVDALLYPSYQLGVRGAIAAILSAAPRASVDLWEAAQGGNQARALELHNRLLALWNAINGSNLPACTKFAQSLQGCPSGHPRSPMPVASDKQREAIRAAMAPLLA